MADEPIIDPPPPEPSEPSPEVVPEDVYVPAGRRRARTALKWTGIGVAGLLLLALAGFAWLNSQFGRSFVVSQVNKMEMASGLDIKVGRIDGSLFGRLTIHDLRLADAKGQFFAAPEAEMDWRPLAYFSNHVDIKELIVPRAHLWRLPELKPSGDPNAPLLPDLDIDIGRLRVDRLMIDPPVTGYRHLLSLSGGARIADGRAQVALDAAAIAGPGLPGGDKLVLRLDAVPEQNRLGLGLRIQAPGNGFVAKLAGLSQPLDASVNGRGSWASWDGRARANLGGKGFASLGVQARNGTFTISGPLNPGLLLAEGIATRLLAPYVQLNLVTTLDKRRADTRLRLSSPAMAVGADGIVDLGRNRFENMKVALRLSQPGAIAPKLSARGLQVAAVLDGAFRTPVVAYDIRADSLGFNGTNVEGLQARGKARIDTDRIAVPVVAHARRITGLNPAFGGLLTNVSLAGTFAVSGPRIVSDDLKVRSDRLNATAVVVADLQRGIYQGGIQGRVNNYLVEGIGLLDLSTHIDVLTTPRGFGLKGHVAIKTRRIDNESARNYLGGNATAVADVAMTPEGVIRVENLRLNAPLLRITSGSGSYWPDGRIAFRGAAISQAYGQVAVIVGGTSTRPLIQLRAANPGFGIGLRDVTATIKATANGYAINAAGQSRYGPFTADVTILTARGPLTIDIRRLVFAGISFSGRVVKTAAGPFAGTLAMNGQGLNGVVRLAAAGRYQRADVDATANGAQIPGPSPILIQRGLVHASVILYPDAPHIVGDAQLAGVRAASFAIARARARIDYRGGRGTAQLFAEGSSGVPFRVAVNAALSPDLIRAALQGQVNGIPIRVQPPAEIRRVAGEWELAPTQLVLPQGNLQLAGRYGRGMKVEARMENFDLSIVNAFSPGLGISGRATGSIDFAQPAGAALPQAEVRLNIAGFSQTGIATRSPPVDLALLGTLRPEGAALNAAIRRGGALVGRAQVRLQPLGGGGSWTTRLMNAPLSGGIRYVGPAEVLWSFSGMANEQLSGAIGIAADFGGRLDNPTFTGVLRASNLTFVDETYGTRITNLALQGRFTNSTLELTQLTGRAGEGTITGHGSVGFASSAGFPVDIKLNFQNAQLAHSDNIGATVTGDLAVTNSRAAGALVSGDLNLGEARYEIIRQGAAEVSELAGVRRKGEPLPDPAKLAATTDTAVPSIWKLDLRLRAPNRVFVSGMGLESEWSADLKVQGTSKTPEIAGRASVIRGTYSFSGQRFDVTAGEIDFNGSRPPNPTLQIAASAEIKDVTVTINVTGTALHPQIAFSSNPGLPQDEILARILFGGSVTEISAIQAVQLAASLNSLRGTGGGLNPLGKLRGASGLSRLRILGADQTTGRGTAVSAGFYLSRKVYIEIVTDAKGFTATQIEVALTKALSILSQVSASGDTGSNVNLRYRKRY
jgi:translocation and assembly module TamB